jgi:hypothetical protein
MAFVKCQPPLNHFIQICLDASRNIANALIPAWIILGFKKNFPSCYRRAKISAIYGLEKYTKPLDRFHVSVYEM